MHLSELELASQIKNTLSEQVQVKIDRGPKSWLERFIYIANLRVLMGIIRNHGFFPEAMPEVDDYTPPISKMSQYACFKDNASKSEYHKIYDSMLGTKKFSSSFTRAAPASTFDPTQHFISMLPLFTMVFIHHVRTTVTGDLRAHPILRLGHYCGAETGNSNATLDNLCFAHKTKVDEVLQPALTKVTKMRDTALRSSGIEIQIYERDVIARSIFVWMDRTALNGAEYSRLTNSKGIWDEGASQNRRMMSVEISELKTPPERLTKTTRVRSLKAGGSGSPKRPTNLNIDKKKMKEDFHKLTKELTSLGETFESTTSKGETMKEMFQRVASTVLQLADTSDLGKFTTLSDLTVAVSSTVPLQQSPNNSTCDANETACDEELKKTDILALLGGHGYNENNTRVEFVPLDIGLLKKAMDWKETDRVDVQNDSFILLKTTNVPAIWRAYTKNSKTGPIWARTLVEAIRQCEIKGWSSSLELGSKPSKTDCIIALISSSVFNSANESLLIQKEAVELSRDYSTSDSESGLSEWKRGKN